jgi:hypothetical protein
MLKFIDMLIYVIKCCKTSIQQRGEITLSPSFKYVSSVSHRLLFSPDFADK